MKTLNANHPDFDQQLTRLTRWEDVSDQHVFNSVSEIISQIKQAGDSALLSYTARFDGVNAQTIAELEVSKADQQAAFAGLPTEQRDALCASAERITAFAEKQKILPFRYVDDLGNTLGQQITPLDRVGLYVPGGKAAYPSSVLMNAIPAKVAGVPELIMVTPTPQGQRNALVLAAAHVARVDRVICVGGAQAVAALAYGTSSIPMVDKIVGPGNTYVATAKRMVFGQVGIDMIAGPSEILIICDGKTNPDWIAMDLFSQAEHDELAQAILISPDARFLEAVATSIQKLITTLPRHDIIHRSLTDRGAFILVDNLSQAADIANRIAAEHLELSVEDPEQLLTQIKHAGAIFMGRYTAEALGDYCAGPNHVLPTSGTARFSSPLGVYDFQKRSSINYCTAAGASTLGRIAAIMAEGEGLSAHAQSARYRS